MCTVVGLPKVIVAVTLAVCGGTFGFTDLAPYRVMLIYDSGALKKAVPSTFCGVVKLFVKFV